jgi:hypothetical protein
MTNRRDLLSECIQPGTPVDVLTSEWCARCANPECVRSFVGQLKFDRRVQDWEEKLFKNPPRMAPDDPRFKLIVAQKFVTIDTTRTPEIRSDWVDPRDLKEPEPAPIPVVTETPVVQAAPPVEAPPAAPSAVEKPPMTTPPKVTTSPRSASAAQSLVGANAPDQSGKVLRGAPGASTNKNDPWAVPEPPSDEVVQPGATIRMGRSGV